MSAAAEPSREPFDDANQALMRAVHPPDWINPPSRGLYDMVVLGGGTAGLVSAIGAAVLGARVGLVERHLLGGDCLNSGCVPSKALLRSARLLAEIRDASRLGLRVAGVEPDFARITQRMRSVRATISPHDSAARLRDAGVDLFFGHGRFTSKRAVEVEGQTLGFKRAVIATGSRPAVPPVPGLTDVPYLTNETVFSLAELPRRMLILGAGPIGCELAQAFARFGSRVSVLDQTSHLLPNEDAGASAVLQRRFVADGITSHLGAHPTRVAHDIDGVRVHYEGQGGAAAAVGDCLVLAVGRSPVVDDLGLDAAGVAASQHGVIVNDRLQTSNRRIYAAGDVCSAFKFTHAADAMARVVIENALFYGRRRASHLVIPWCTYTDPEVAHVGLHERDARQRGYPVETITVALSEIDRAVLDDQADGFVRVHHSRGRPLGCTIVASHAGELIAEATYAITHRGTLSDLSNMVHPYPTQAEAFRVIGDEYRLSRVTPNVRRWLERYFRWTR